MPASKTKGKCAGTTPNHRYELEWIGGKCERVANGGVFRSASQIYTIGHMRLPELIKIQCFKNASQLYMLD